MHFWIQLVNAKATHPPRRRRATIEHAEGSSSSSLSPDPTECAARMDNEERSENGGKRWVAVVVELDPISASTNEEEREEGL